MKAKLFLILFFFSPFANAASSKDLFLDLDALGLSSPVGAAGEKVVSLQLISCMYVASGGAKTYACWYQNKSTTAVPNNAQPVTDAAAKNLYFALANAGFQQRFGGSSGQIFVSPLTCHQTMNPFGMPLYSCANSN